MYKESIIYPTYDEVIIVYEKTIKYSGDGFSGVRDSGQIELVLDLVQNDTYYPDFHLKLAMLVYKFCTGHYFHDGNKRIALALGAYVLLKNGYVFIASRFMSKMESIIYHVAARNIREELFYRIIKSVVNELDFDEELKIDIANAIS